LKDKNKDTLRAYINNHFLHSEEEDVDFLINIIELIMENELVMGKQIVSDFIHRKVNPREPTYASPNEVTDFNTTPIKQKSSDGII